MVSQAAPLIAIVAGEASGDNLGAALIAAIRERVPNARFIGVPGPRMREEGCEALASSEELAVMGLVEILRHLPRLFSLRRRLLREFREHGNAVLLGTASFWEGVDVKGDALRLVIIEKLPFASPDDPLVKARIEFLRRRGDNPFRDYQLPEAVLALKQGVGRLIRSEEDRGVIVICDPRLTTKGYGRTFRASLPPMPVTRERAEATRFLRRLR